MYTFQFPYIIFILRTYCRFFQCDRNLFLLNYVCCNDRMIVHIPFYQKIMSIIKLNEKKIILCLCNSNFYHLMVNYNHH